MSTPTVSETKAEVFPELGDAVETRLAAEGGEGEEDGERGHYVMNQVSDLESFCVSCEENGKTNILMTRIPFFREVILMAFSCEHCGFRSSEVQSAEVQAKGYRFELTAKGPADLNRQVIKSDKGVIRIPSLDFEIPAGTQKGVFSTVEGIVRTAADNLAEGQPIRRATQPEVYEQIEAFLVTLRSIADGEAFPFTFTLDDPTGNSFLENPNAPAPDPAMVVTQYRRTKEQDEVCGLFAGNAGAGGNASGKFTEEDGEADTEAGAGAGAGAGAAGTAPHSIEGDSGTDWAGVKDAQPPKEGGKIKTVTDRARASAKHSATGKLEGLVFDTSTSGATKEVMNFAVDCYACSESGETRMCVTDIPHFKEVIIMSFLCDECGYRSVEVKGGGAVPEQGTISTLKLTPGESMQEDLRRDVIKSDTASVEIPEIGLELMHGSLGGVYTTVEGLLMLIKDKLVETNPFHAAGTDSKDDETFRTFETFLSTLESLTQGETEFTVIMHDPMANTWIHSPYAPEPDPRLSHERYTRSYDENRDLGLLDMVAPEDGQVDETERVTGLGTVDETEGGEEEEEEEEEEKSDTAEPSSVDASA